MDEKEELNSTEELNNGEQVTVDEPTEENKRKSNSAAKIIAAILGGIVCIALAALVMISLLSPKHRFFSLVSSAFSDASKEINNFEKSTFGQMLMLDTGSKLAANVKISGKIETDDEDVKEWLGNLESFELNAKENLDISNDYSDTVADFTLNGEKFLSGTLIQNKNIISAKLDDITDGYITVDDNALAELWEKIGYDGPTSLTSQTDMLKELNFSKSDIKDLKNALEAFASGFSTAFSDEDFAYGTGTVSYDEGNIECKSMDFIVDAKKLNDGLISGLEKVSSKEKYIDAIYKLTSALDKVNGYQPLTREEFGTNFETMLQEISNLEFTGEEQGFIIRIYYKGNDILKTEMLSEDYNTKILEFTIINSKNSGYYRLCDGSIVYEDKSTTIDKITTHTVNVDYINYETGEIEEGYGSEIVIKIDNTKKNEQNINLKEKVRLLSYDDMTEDFDIMSIEPTVIRDYTLKGKIDGNNNNIEITMLDNNETLTNTFSINATIEEKANFDCITVNENENFNVTDKTDDELIAKKDKIIDNWKNTAGKDSSKVQQFNMAISMYLSMIMPVEYYDEGDYEDLDLNSVDLEGIEGVE